MKVPTFSGIFTNKSWSKQIGTIKFIFAAKGPKSPWLSDVLIPLDEVQYRMKNLKNGDFATIYESDLENWRKKRMPFPLYNQKGTLAKDGLDKFKTIFDFGTNEESASVKKLRESAGPMFKLSAQAIAEETGDKPIKYYDWLTGRTIRTH